MCILLKAEASTGSIAIQIDKFYFFKCTERCREHVRGFKSMRSWAAIYRTSRF